MNVTYRNSSESVGALYKVDFVTHTMTTGTNCLIVNKLVQIVCIENDAYCI